MQYSSTQLTKDQWEELSSTMKHKDALMRELGVSKLPLFFDIGDCVGFFYGKNSGDHSIGTIVAEDRDFVTLITEKGATYNVSPFYLFPLGPRRKK